MCCWPVRGGLRSNPENKNLDQCALLESHLIKRFPCSCRHLFTNCRYSGKTGISLSPGTSREAPARRRGFFFAHESVMGGEADVSRIRRFVRRPRKHAMFFCRARSDLPLRLPDPAHAFSNEVMTHILWIRLQRGAISGGRGTADDCPILSAKPTCHERRKIDANDPRRKSSGRI